MDIRSLGLIAVASSLCWTPANASTITYDIGTTTAVFAPTLSDTLTGTFTIDPTNLSNFPAIDINITGNFFTGTYNVPGGCSICNPPYPPAGSVTGTDASIDTAVVLVFQNALSTSPDPITAVWFFNSLAGNLLLVSTSASGTATPATPPATPLPAALPLFVTGLGALGLLFWRGKRKNAVGIAAV
jgi:hypothetical protein